MHDHTKPNRKRDRGQVTILVLLGMAIFLLAFVGLATDYTNFWFQRQAIQGAADATCQAAAMDLLLYAEGQKTANMNFTPSVGGTVNCSSSSTAAPCIIAKYNGYDGTLASNNVVMSFPGSVSGAPAAPPGVAVPYVQVDVTNQAPAYFTRLLTGISTVAVHASATCGLTAPGGPVPLLVLHPTAAGALSLSGSASINVIGGSWRTVQVNSSSSSAVSVGTVNLSLAGPNDTGGDFAVFGGPSSKPGGITLGSTGHYVYPATPLSDPYAQVTAPTKPTNLGTQTAVAYKVNGCPDSGGCTEYTAGYYSGGITVKNANAILDPGLYYIVGGMTLGPNSTVRVSTANGDGSGGVVLYFSGSGSISVDANSGKKATTDAYYLNGSNSPNGVPSRAMECPGGPALPPQLPATVNGSILLGPCTGSYADPSGQNRGFVFFQDRSAASVLPTWGGGGQFLLAGYMYFHQCRADGTGLNCSQPGSGGYGTTFGMQGNACSGSYMVGSLVTDQISIGGTPCINMILSPNKSFPEFKVVFLK
jgi:putative Flp pilus-assembly TadE/G-like protein